MNKIMIKNVCAGINFKFDGSTTEQGLSETFDKRAHIVQNSQ